MKYFTRTIILVFIFCLTSLTSCRTMRTSEKAVSESETASVMASRLTFYRTLDSLSRQFNLSADSIIMIFPNASSPKFPSEFPSRMEANRSRYVLKSLAKIGIERFCLVRGRETWECKQRSICLTFAYVLKHAFGIAHILRHMVLMSFFRECKTASLRIIGGKKFRKLTTYCQQLVNLFLVFEYWLFIH